MRALGEIGHPEVEQILEDVVRFDRERWVKEAAEEALIQFQEFGFWKNSLEAVIELSNGTHSSKVISWLGDSPLNKVITHLEWSIENDPHPKVREAAAEALIKLKKNTK